MSDAQILLANLEKIHTTPMGIKRIKHNLDLKTSNVVLWCKQQISHVDCQITRQGKNYYCKSANCLITINAHSYTIITAHKIRN